MTLRKSKHVKKVSRIRRGRSTRCRIKILNVPSLVVNRTPKHIYAQIVLDGNVIASASTLNKIFKDNQHPTTGNISAAVLVGKYIADAAIKAGISNIAFDRSGYKYHGRVKALADSAREAGLKF